MTDHFKHIYASGAAQYDALVSREDHQGHLLPAIEAIRPLDGLDVVEFGAGTGRLTRLIAPRVKSVRAYDDSAHMLEAAAQTLTGMGLANWHVAQADNRALPEEDHSADVTLAGWSFGHMVGWSPDHWRDNIGAMLSEMRRITRPGGVLIILETLGTGTATPAPPTAGLAEYYQWLEEVHGFARTWLRTDYAFMSVGEAEQLTRFFFGDALADRIAAEGVLVLPECTGLWWQHLPR